MLAEDSSRRKSHVEPQTGPADESGKADAIASNDGESIDGTVAGDGAAGASLEGTDGNPRHVPSFPIAGIGASAGGLEAITQLLGHLPIDTGMAFVFVQHLDPHHKSSLVEILSRVTRLPVVTIADGQRIEPDHVYVAPANQRVAVMHQTFQLMDIGEGAARRQPIDYFFRSLAEDHGHMAVGVVLSGTGSDGTSGLRAIKAEGGIALAQTPESAKYAGMPHSAATAEVDRALPPDLLAEELAHIARHPNLSPRRQSGGSGFTDAPEAMQKIFMLLRKASGVDFSEYKQSTVERRLTRRLVLHKIDSLKTYVKYLEQNPPEVSALFEDLLINVTEFFREPDVFEVLKREIFPRIFSRDADAPIRIWVPACSTGEEAYSIAMALLECVGPNETLPHTQIFATDVSSAAIEKARSGRYPDQIADQVGPERLRRFFIRSERGYQVVKMIRDMVIFAKQNVTRDPPFSNLDLLSCRNLLIYMGPTFQRRIFSTFHYALKPGGYLLLGQSETIGGFAELFALAQRKHKIYIRKPTAARLPLDLSSVCGVPPLETPRPPRAAQAFEADMQIEADRLLLQRFAPPGVVINGEMEIVQVRGQTGRYLEPAPGAATLNVLKMAREGLAIELRAAIHMVVKTNQRVRKEGLQCRHDGGMLTLAVEVIPMPLQPEQAYYLVLFDESRNDPARDAAKAAPPADDEGHAEPEFQRLRDELAQTKETLQHIIEDQETTNEELRAANEEIQSANEELQSTNEELETAKEELQSTNEELTTLNSELEVQNIELNQAIDDFTNLHNSVNIPVVLLGNDLRIRSFTPPAERSLKLIAADVGRPVGQLNLGIQVQNLEERVARVIETLDTYEEEVQGHDGRTYSLRIRPYRTTEDKISGAVVALIDIHDRRIAEHDLQTSRSLAEALLSAIDAPAVVLDAEHRLQAASVAFRRLFGLLPSQSDQRALDQRLDDVSGPALRQILDRVRPGGVIEDEPLEIVAPTGDRQTWRVSVRGVEDPRGLNPYTLISFKEPRDD